MMHAHANLNILLIEDNEDHAELVMRSLEDHHFPNQIHHLDDGAKAIDFFKHLSKSDKDAGSSSPDLILLDLKLPKVNGHEVLAFLKKDPALKKIPVIVLTSSDDKKDVHTAYENHVNSYLVKPLQYADFSTLLNDIGHYWLGRNVYS